ncbi:uncharacterized protein TRIADDRAFT_61226 [Trichoplax adhaerens]|uniref:Plus3 domain-containing protein n=1 Tax=Trichoplax adhaerens TaxID=10228 RepID=B3SAD9_TRIAD|nr:hypothetical protein TRIADDRAFT_61226 [Trichoplax adhaerens]EDV20240.1 hypothetical protein TRIADDRAFT_61226 [Trichoplax adhaerens]|eukprot:XP_002117190.1 hypothetical protein TRIADDRAFT_61226 [Trichoplax adhaerens]
MAKLTEKEREQELFNRVEKREALKTRYTIEMKLRKARKDERKKKKNILAASALDRQDRRRAMKRKRDKELEKIRSRREKRISKKPAEPTTFMQSRRHLTTSDVFTDDDDDDIRGTSKSDTDNFKDGYSPIRHYDSPQSEIVTYITTRAQLSTIRLSRSKLERWVHMPFFAETVVGCFVRVGIGSHEGKQIYRVAEIIDVIESGRVYNLNKTSTNKVLHLRHGLDEQNFRMEYVSNSNFTDNEFLKWKTKMKELDLNLPSQDDVDKKKEDIIRAANYNFDDADIDEIIAEKDKFRKNPSNFAVKQSKLEQAMEAAQYRGDEDEVNRIKSEIENLDKKAEQISKWRSQRLDPIMSINQRNRQKNLAEIEKALAREVASDGVCADPFTRRKCQPILVSMVKDVQNVYTSSPTKSSNKLPKSNLMENSNMSESSIGQTPIAAELNNISSQDLGASPKLEGQKEVVNLFSAHDFDVKIDIDVGPPAPGISIPRKQTDNKAANQGTSRRCLNLSDYKKRKGLI